jgi:hypothetical protein
MTTGQGWFDVNEARRFPLDDNADVGGLPDDVIADLKIVVPDTVLAAAGGAVPRVVSLSSGASYISLVIAVGDKEIAWYGGDRVMRTPLPLEPLATGVGGFVVFGSGAETYRGTVILPNGIVSAPAFSVSFETGVSTVTFVSDGSATPLADVIKLDLAAGIDINYRGNVAGYHNVIEFSLPESVDPVVNEQLLGNCGKNVQGNTCAPAIINTVNGVRADKNGKLSIRVINNTLSTLSIAGGGTATGVLVTALSLTRACEDRLTATGEPDVSAGLIKKC